LFIQVLSSLIRPAVVVVSFSFFAVTILGGSPQPSQNDQSENNDKVDDVKHDGVVDDDILVTIKIMNSFIIEDDLRFFVFKVVGSACAKNRATTRKSTRKMQIVIREEQKRKHFYNALRLFAVI
jgi:hypothetical protein